MPKKVKNAKSKQTPPIRTFPISKHKTFLFNLNNFIKMLQTHYAELSSKQFLGQIHNYVTRYKESIRGKDAAIEIAKKKIKICKKCDGWSGKTIMLQCTLCQDFYHQNCAEQESNSMKQTGLCPVCDKQKIVQFNKEAYLNELIQDSCYSCKNQRRDKQAFVHCMRCSHQFHKKCYGKNVVVCQQCNNLIDQQLKNKKNMRQSTLEQFSSKKKKIHQSPISLKTMSDDEFVPFDKKSFDQSQTQAYREKDSFCYNIMKLTKEEIEVYKQSLQYALKVKKMQYTQQLYPDQCSLDINNEQSLDFGLDHMSRQEYDIYKAYKRQPIGPFKLVYKKGMGYDVIADKEIRQKTLICEYIGEVVTLRRCIELEKHSKNDSVMQLRSGCNSDETLMIRPQKKANMARFINGINNSKPSSKPNVATVRKLAKGMPTVILYSIKTIKKGESLLYDYNAGFTTCQYDTSNFI